MNMDSKTGLEFEPSKVLEHLIPKFCFIKVSVVR